LRTVPMHPISGIATAQWNHDAANEYVVLRPELIVAARGETEFDQRG
jgi:hypothetical protein